MSGADERKGHATKADLIGRWVNLRALVLWEVADLPDHFQVRIYQPGSGGWSSIAVHVSQLQLIDGAT